MPLTNIIHFCCEVPNNNNLIQKLCVNLGKYISLPTAMITLQKLKYIFIPKVYAICVPNSP